MCGGSDSNMTVCEGLCMRGGNGKGGGAGQGVGNNAFGV